jgi:hypothetical protein
MKWIGDFEDLKATRAYPSMRTFIRCFVAEDGMLTAAAFQVRMRGIFRVLAIIGLIPRNLQTYECVTELSDGTFVSTSNTKGIDRMEFLGIEMHRHVPATPLQDILAFHRQRVERLVTEMQEKVVQVRSKEELLSSQARMHRVKVKARGHEGSLSALP